MAASPKEAGLAARSPRLGPARGLWIALAILFLVGVVSYRTSTAVVDSTGWVEHTHEVIERLGEERAALAEPSLRAGRMASPATTRRSSLTPPLFDACVRMGRQQGR